MAADARPIDAARVQEMLRAQAPAFADYDLSPVRSDGTDNAMFRLGDALCVRLPRRAAADAAMGRELDWLARLAPLPLEIPVPVASGAPCEAFPARWGVYQWIEGEPISETAVEDPAAAAAALGGFIVALRAKSARGAPLAGRENFWRGAPLAIRSASVDAAIAALHDLYDPDALRTAWRAALDAPVWNRPPAWAHGDLHAGNLLARGGALCAAIDFGLMGAGDPAVDLLPAWSMFGGAAREAFREAAQADAAMWARGRGWALSTALVALAYYRGGLNPFLEAQSKRVIAAVLGQS